MTAGRELDALVAEKVMGCKIRRVYRTCRDGTPWFEVFCECGHGEHGDTYMEERRISSDPYDIWRYSTSIEAAGRVVEKLAADGLHLNLTEYKMWCCSFVKEMDELTYAQVGYAEADTAPLAICLAALKAVGVVVS